MDISITSTTEGQETYGHKLTLNLKFKADSQIGSKI